MESRLPFAEIITVPDGTSLPSHCHLAMGDVERARSAGLPPLTEEERREQSSFRNEQRRLEFHVTRTVLRDLVRCTGADPGRFRIRKDRYGKPRGRAGDRAIPIGMAHSGNRVLCAVSTGGELGVDLEPTDRKVSAGLRQRIQHPAEGERLRSVTTIRLWTIKEALVKLDGRGLRNNMREIEILAAEQNQFEAIFNNDKRAKICSFQHHNYWLALAYHKK